MVQNTSAIFRWVSSSFTKVLASASYTVSSNFKVPPMPNFVLIAMMFQFFRFSTRHHSITTVAPKHYNLINALGRNLFSFWMEHSLYNMFCFFSPVFFWWCQKWGFFPWNHYPCSSERYSGAFQFSPQRVVWVTNWLPAAATASNLWLNITFCETNVSISNYLMANISKYFQSMIEHNIL